MNNKLKRADCTQPLLSTGPLVFPVSQCCLAQQQPGLSTAPRDDRKQTLRLKLSLTRVAKILPANLHHLSSRNSLVCCLQQTDCTRLAGEDPASAFYPSSRQSPSGPPCAPNAQTRQQPRFLTSYLLCVSGVLGTTSNFQHSRPSRLSSEALPYRLPCMHGFLASSCLSR